MRIDPAHIKRQGRPVRFPATLLLVGLLTALAACEQPPPDDRIIVGLALPADIPDFDFINGMYEVFRDELESRSGIRVQLIYGGALGSPTARLNQVRRGVIQMTDTSEAVYATLYPDIQVLGMPFLFPDEATAWAILDGEFGQELADRVRQHTGIRVLGWWESGGFRHFSATRPLRDPDDFRGLKFRAIGPLSRVIIEALGGAAASVSFGELYTSLRTGVVDGQDNAIATFNLVKLYEVQPHLALTAHSYAFAPLGINDQFYSALSDADQAAIQEAAAIALEFNRQASRRLEAQALQHARSRGVSVHEFGEAQRERMAHSSQPPARAWLARIMIDPDLIEQALDAVADARTETAH